MKVALFMFLSTTLAYSQSACALRVRVYGANLHPTDATVGVRFDDGRSLAPRQTKNGVVEFCSIGWGTFSVIVGQEMCGQVEVKHLYIAEGDTLEVPVLYRNCHGMLIDSACSVIVRAQGPDGNDIPTAKITIAGRPNSRYTPDEWGRIFFGIRFGETAAVTLSANGYGAEGREIGCTREKPRIEETFHLRPTR
jgi:hypothetical protein